MGSLGAYLLVYVLGGVTLIPSILLLLLAHAYFTLIPRPNAPKTTEDHEFVQHPTDNRYSIRSGADSLEDKFQRPHESDVAAGYFTVCREYVPGGVNGKLPERITPAGEVVSADSPSVYQAMYRSIFDRKQSPTIEPGKGNNWNARKGRNIFYIVLRHGHLMLYDNSEQIEVRYVISLSHHDVSIYAGGEPIPEGELWIKRNAICLSRKQSTLDILESRTSTLPFYLFSDNSSEKEDFYFAILKNLEKTPGSPDSPPTAQCHDVDDILKLVQRLHSSEEQLQTRWFNALVGRLFLALYKTPELEALIWNKIAKKISRVKKPSFMTRIALQKIDAGEGAPFITNPKLKDLTMDGDCCVEADVKYNGNFRIEVAATARIDLGARFKPREVDLVLAVVLRRLKGHALLRFKPPPSNRLWISFETTPDMEMAIEPIVSSRQITYGIILRAIESRIREVVNETLVQPFWDDIPFLDSASQAFRGGIWQQARESHDETVITEEPGKRVVPSPESSSDEHHPIDDEPATSMATVPVPLSHSHGLDTESAMAGKGLPSVRDVDDTEQTDRPQSLKYTISSTSTESTKTADSPGTDPLTQIQKHPYEDARSTTVDSSAFPRPISQTSLHSRFSRRHTISQSSEDIRMGILPQAGIASDKSSTYNPRDHRYPAADNDPVKEDSVPTASLGSLLATTKSPEARQAITTIGSAAAAARKWGWNVLGRGDQSQKANDWRKPDHPMGRGRPLPPPGTPLPPPEKALFRVSPISVPKRKPLASSLFSDQSEKVEQHQHASRSPPHGSSDSPIGETNAQSVDDLLVIKAPLSSEPNSPLLGDNPDMERRKISAEVTQSDSSLPLASETTGLEGSPSCIPDLQTGTDSQEVLT